MKPTDMLKQQHREAEELFEQIEAAEPEHRAELVESLADALAAHMAVEEEVFYPRALEATEDDDLVEESFEEHAIAKTELFRVLSTSADEDDFEPRLEVLKELVLHHVEEEEQELFPEVEASMEASELEDLAAEMEVIHANAMEAGHDQILNGSASQKRRTGRSRAGA